MSPSFSLVDIVFVNFVALMAFCLIVIKAFIYDDSFQ